MSYAIQLAGEAPPSFFSLRAGRNLGSPTGWTADRELALQFARPIDAEGFRDSYLVHQASMCIITPLERTA